MLSVGLREEEFTEWVWKSRISRHRDSMQLMKVLQVSGS